MTAPDPAPALSAERTRLAWWRTALALLVLAALVLRTSGGVVLTLGLAVVATGLVAADLLDVRSTAGRTEGVAATRAGAARLAFLAAAVVLLGAASAVAALLR